MKSRGPGGAHTALIPVVLGFALLLFCHRVQANEQIHVVHEGCEGIDTEKFGTLLLTELQLSAAFATTTQMTVELHCTVDAVRITINDTLTQKSLERTIPNSGSDKPGWSRELALAASQLCIASWLELLVADPPSEPEETESEVSKEIQAQKQKAVEQARDLASKAIVEELIKEPRNGRISLAGGVRLRPISPSLASFYFAARGGGWLGDSIGLFANLAFETGHFKHTLGQVRALAGLAGLSLAWRHYFSEWFGLELAPTFSIGYSSLKGDMVQADVQSDSIGGVTGEFVLNITPAFKLGRILLSPDFMVGYMIKNPRGRIITDQTERVSFGGLILGLTLEIGILF